MPICKRCNEKFPNRIKIDGEIRNVHTRKFCIKCSPFNKQKTREELSKENKGWCSKCKQALPLNQFYKNYNKCKSCIKKKSSEYQQKLKKLCVKYAGDCCENCGYDKYMGALEFHHKDPKSKDFKISRMGSALTERIKKEINKCLLLCANCHREEHARLKGILK